MSEREKRRDTTLGVCWESCGAKMLWESKSPPEYNAGLLIQPTDTGSPPLRETMEGTTTTNPSEEATGGTAPAQRHPEQTQRRGGVEKNAIRRCFPSLLLLLISIKGCWMSAAAWNAGKVSDHSPKKISSSPFSRRGNKSSLPDGFYHTKWQQHGRLFFFFFKDDFEEGAVSQHKRGMDKTHTPSNHHHHPFFCHLSFPNGLGAPEQLRPLCLLSQSKISLSSCLNPAETLHPDSNTSPQLLHSIIPCLPPFSLLL